MILITLYLVGVKNTDSWRATKRDLQRAFSLDVSMDPSSPLTISTNGECFTCSGFSLGETGCLGSLEFIIDCFGSLSLSPRRSDSDTPFMGSTHSGSPSPLRAMIEDSTDEFHMASSGEAASGLPTPRRCDTGGSTCSHHSHVMARECSSHSCHYNGSTAGTDAAARHWPPLRAMVHFLGGAKSTSPRSTTQHQARGITKTRQAHRQASNRCGLAT
jgi:hypothetical protein